MIAQLSLPPAIDFKAGGSVGGEDEGGEGELEGGGFEGNKAANESIMAGALSRAERAGAGEDTALAGVIPGSEGIGGRPADWASAR